MADPNRPRRILGGFAMAFGAVTIVSGARALFFGAEMGMVVPFVLWFNFCAGFAYVVAGGAIWVGHGWGHALSALLLAATVAVFAAFGLHVLSGGDYEPRTVAAMSLRTAFWAGVLFTLRRRPEV